MKLTNNAIKFLLAQYRAIYKNAYFKGLVGAALVTMSVGVASADGAGSTGGASGYDSWEAAVKASGAGATWDVEQSGQSVNTENKFYKNINIKSGGNLTFSGANNSFAGTIDVQSGGKLTINAIWLKGYKNTGSTDNDPAGDEFLGKLNVEGELLLSGGTDKQAAINAKDIILNNGSKTTLTGGAEGGYSNWSQTVQLDGGYSGGKFEIKSGAEVNLNKDSHLVSARGSNFNIAGTINFKNDARVSFIRATDNYNHTNNTFDSKVGNSILTFDGAKVNVEATSKGAAIYAGVANINSGTEINISGTSLTLDGDLNNKLSGRGSTGIQAGAEDNNAAGYFTMNGADTSITIDAEKSLVVGAGKFDADAAKKNGLNYNVTTLDVKSGTIDNKGTVTVKGVLKLADGVTLKGVKGAKFEVTRDDTGGAPDKNGYKAASLVLSDGQFNKFITDGGSFTLKNAYVEFTGDADLSKAEFAASGKSVNVTSGANLTTKGTLTLGKSSAAKIDDVTLTYNAKNLAFTGSEVSLGNAVNLTSNNGAAKNPTATEGTITGDFTLAADGALKINGGNYTASNTWTLTSGTVSVTGSADSGSALLDLTGADLKWGTAATGTAINISGDATNAAKVKISNTDFNELLSGADTSGSFNIKNHGTLEVNGDITAAFGDFSGTATHITFTNGGTLDVSGTATLTTDNDTTTPLDISAGTLNANSLVLNNSGTDTNVTFKKGTINVANSVSSNMDSITVGGTAANAANLNLLANTNGTINTNLIADTSGNISFAESGNWSFAPQKGLQVTAGSLTVGTDATVSASHLKVGTGTATINGTFKVTGDGNNETADISGLDKITVAGGTLDLGKVADTLTATAKKEEDGKTTIDFKNNGAKLTANVATINVNLEGIEGLTSIDIGTANSLFSQLASGTGLVNITGNVAPSLPPKGTDGTVSFDDLKGKGQTDVNLNFSTDESKKTVVSGVNGSIAGGWQALQTSGAGADQSVSVKNGTLSLHGTNKNSNNIVQSSDGKVAGVKLEGETNLIVESTGNIGTISGSDGSLVIGQNANINVVDAKAKAADVTVKNLNTTGNLTAGTVTAQAFEANSGAVVTADKLAISDAGSFNTTQAQITAYNADLSKATEATIAGGSLNVQAVDGSASGKLTAATLIVNSGAVVNAKSATVNNLTINGGANLVAETLELKNNGEIRVGRETSNVDAGSSANVSVNALKLGKGTLIIDPDFGQQTATVFTSSFKDVPAAEGARGVSANNTLEGRIIVGKNSAFGFGTDEQAFRSTLAKYQDGGSLSADGVGAYVYVDQQLTIANGASLTVGTQEIDKLEAKASDGHAIYLDSGAAIQVTANALSKASEDNAVINVTGNNRTLESHNGVIYVPAFFEGEDITSLLDGVSLAIEDDANNALYLTTENGLFTYTVTKTAQLTGDEVLKRETNHAAVNSLKAKISTSAGALFDTINDPNTTKYDTWTEYEKAHNAPTGPVKPANGVEVVKEGSGYKFISDAFASPDANINQNVDRVARLAAFGASVQVANSASQSTIDAVSGRLGMGNSANKLTVADNADGAAMWVTPIYRNSDVDSFSAQNINYGSEFDFFGAALGFDYSIGGNIRVGGALNFGSGDADGKGAASGVKNDFSYFGGAIYAGFNPMPALALTADITYTVVDNDLEFESGMADYGKVSGSTDSSALSFGVNAQYTFKGASLDVAPHIGARYTRLDVDGFDFKSAKEGYLGSNDSDALSYFSIPLGVTVSKDFVSDNWTIRPAVDFTVTINAGDDELDGKTYFEGVEGYDMQSKTEVLDSFTYGATAGVAGSNGAFSFGINVGYTGSSEVTEYGISANARFVF